MINRVTFFYDSLDAAFLKQALQFILIRDRN